MRAQQRVELRSARRGVKGISELLWRERLMPILSAHRDRRFVGIDPKPSRPDKVETPADSAADIKNPARSQSPHVPRGRIWTEALPTSSASPLQPAGGACCVVM